MARKVSVPAEVAESLASLSGQLEAEAALVSTLSSENERLVSSVAERDGVVRVLQRRLESMAFGLETLARENLELRDSPGESAPKKRGKTDVAPNESRHDLLMKVEQLSAQVGELKWALHEALEKYQAAHASELLYESELKRTIANHINIHKMEAKRRRHAEEEVRRLKSRIEDLEFLLDNSNPSSWTHSSDNEDSMDQHSDEDGEFDELGGGSQDSQESRVKIHTGDSSERDSVPGSRETSKMESPAATQTTSSDIESEQISDSLLKHDSVDRRPDSESVKKEWPLSPSSVKSDAVSLSSVSDNTSRTSSTSGSTTSSTASTALAQPSSSISTPIPAPAAPSSSASTSPPLPSAAASGASPPPAHPVPPLRVSVPPPASPRGAAPSPRTVQAPGVLIDLALLEESLRAHHARRQAVADAMARREQETAKNERTLKTLLNSSSS